MNIQQLRFLVEAVRQDFNLTEVANKLAATQSGVSKQITELETELGVQIFLRRGKRLVGLSPAGEGIIPLARNLLTEFDNIKTFATQFVNQDQGKLIIATTHNQARYALPPIIKNFTHIFPKVQLDLRQGKPKDIEEALLNGQVDIAIATEAFEQNNNLIILPCFRWQHVVIVPKDHPLNAFGDLSIRDLAKYPIITYAQEFSGRKQIDLAFHQAGLKPNIHMTAMDADIITTYVAAGLGIGLVSEMAALNLNRTDILALSQTKTLFNHSTTKVALPKSNLIRSYTLAFLSSLLPYTTPSLLRKLLSALAESLLTPETISSSHKTPDFEEWMRQVTASSKS